MSTGRVITVVSTKGGKINKITTDAQNWGDLKSLIESDYDLDNLKAVENINKTTLENSEAKLPEGDFRLFLRPSKTKAGSSDFSLMSFSELKDFIKNNLEAKEALNKFGSNTGRNWTQLKTAERVAVLTNYYQNSDLESVFVEEFEDLETENISDDVETALLKTLREIFYKMSLHFSSRLEKSSDKVLKHLDKMIDIQKEPIYNQLSKEEQEDIEREMRELEEGF